MRLIYFSAMMLSSVAFAGGDINIGGNDSFNGNNNNININASNQVTNSQFEVQKHILERQAAINSKAFDTSLSKEERAALVHEIALLDKAEKINKQNMSNDQKNELCKKEADAYISFFGHQIGFSYEKCDDIFLAKSKKPSR